MKAALRIAALAAGLGLCIWYLSRADLDDVGNALRKLGWFAPVVLVPYSLVYVVDTLAWSLSFHTRPAMSLGKLFLIRWSGESLNNVLPSASIGGEALKVYLLRKRGVSVRDATSSVVVAKTAQTIAQLLFISVASLTALLVIKGNVALQIGMSTVLAGGVAVVGLFLWLQRRGLFSSLTDVAAFLGFRPRFIERRRPHLKEVDGQIAGFYRVHRSRFFACTAIYFVGWLLDTLEVLLVAFLMGMPINWWQALIVEAFTGVAKAFGMWVPGSLGVQESGILMIGRAAGLEDSLCLAYALIRRGRDTLFALLGWLFLYVEEASVRGLSARLVSQPKD